MVFDNGTDWGEVAEPIADSYCTPAPKKLRELVDRGQ
jgi:hypothetical protein